MKTIAIANQKGGTGKTTTTYNLGIALTQQGYRVLMVDFDPQGNLSCYCGIPPEKDLDQTITELLMKTSCEKPIGNRECVYQTGRKEAAARVDFIPSNLRLAGFELAMGTMMCREVLLNAYAGNALTARFTKTVTLPPGAAGFKGWYENGADTYGNVEWASLLYRMDWEALYGVADGIKCRSVGSALTADELQASPPQISRAEPRMARQSGVSSAMRTLRLNSI